MYFIQGEDIKMKITRKQLRRIIKEAIDPNADQLEAAYAVAYAEGYVQGFEEQFSLTLNRNPKLGNQGEKWMPLSDEIGNLQAVLVATNTDIKRQNPDLDLEEEFNVLMEAADAAKLDFESSIYKCVEQIDILINRQTPMGMSAAEGLDVFGIEAGGVSYKDTTVGDARALVALMDNDNLLSWLDELESMRQYGELK